MNYKEKYENALERAKNYYSTTDSVADNELIELIFPELKESEDERIRKGLIKALSSIGKRNWGGIDVFESIAWLEKQGEQKSADKVEPKFKVGDWILYSGDHYEGVRHITKIDENGYYIERNGLPHGIIPFNHEICMRLWTIQDAKDGDVLVNGSNIFIFHFFSDTRLMGYCHVNTDNGRFYDDLGRNECFCLIDAVVYPATKEQRDALMKAMADARYTFDFEKKELKKIEQKPTEWSEEDESYLNTTIAYLKDAKEFKKSAENCINWLKSLKQRIGG